MHLNRLPAGHSPEGLFGTDTQTERLSAEIVSSSDGGGVRSDVEAVVVGLALRRLKKRDARPRGIRGRGVMLFFPAQLLCRYFNSSSYLNDIVLWGLHGRRG